ESLRRAISRRCTDAGSRAFRRVRSAVSARVRGDVYILGRKAGLNGQRAARHGHASISIERASAGHEEQGVTNNPVWSARRVVNPLVVALAVPPAAAQDKGDDATGMQALRTAMKTDKRAYIASQLSLTSAEAKRFWPIYDSYQRI